MITRGRGLSFKTNFFKSYIKVDLLCSISFLEVVSKPQIAPKLKARADKKAQFAGGG